MITTKTLKTYCLLLSIFFSLFQNKVSAQVGISPADLAPIKLDCPQYPVYDFFDRNCLIKTAEPTGEIQLPQAGVDGLNLESPMWLTMPVNKPGWALGIAHAWNWHRNMINKVNYPKMGYYMAILAQETGTACTCSAQFDPNAWPWTTHRFDNWDTKCSASNPHEGCFQMEEWNGWGQLTQIYAYRFDCSKFKDNIPGHRVATAAMALSYRNVYNTLVWEYSWNSRLWEILDNPNCDPYAYEKMLAVGWNSWVGGMYQNMAGLYDPQVNFYDDRVGTANHDCWNLDATVGWYPDAVGWSMSVLYDNPAYCHYQYPWLTQQNNVPAGSQVHTNLPLYDYDYKWQDVADYIDTICNFYYEYKSSNDPQKNADAKAQVKAVFDALAGGAGGTVSFKNLGPVVDELILVFPKENPLMNALHDDSTPSGYRGNWFSRCPGEYAPASHIEKRGYDSDTICIGQTLVCASVIDGGEDPGLTYTWTVDGIDQGVNDSLFNFKAAAVGEYMISANVCSGLTNGCADANCFMRVYVKDCKSCNLFATSTSTNTPCQNMPGGTIDLEVTDAANYTIEYDGPYKGTIDGSGTSASITGLVNGVYNITLTDKDDPTCVFHLSQEVFYDTPMNAKVTASIKELNECDAELEAVIEQENCNCEYTVYMREVAPERWERYMFIRLTPSNGLYEEIRGRVFENGDVTVTRKFSMCTGESIKVEGRILPASGSCDPLRTDAVNIQRSAYEVWVVDPNGVEVKRDIIPIGATEQYNDYFLFEVPIVCPFTPDPYTYEWNPGNIAGNPVDVFHSKTEDVTYTVTATNQSNPQCTLQDTVTVPFTCQTPCVAADSAVISTNDSLTQCDTGSVTFTANEVLGYEYRWYQNDAEVARGIDLYTYTATDSGSYYLIITDTLNPNDTICMTFSDTMEFELVTIDVNIGADTTICKGESIQYFSDSLNVNWDYAWNTGAITDTISVNTAGEYILTVTNEFGCVAEDTAAVILDSVLLDLGDDLTTCVGSLSIDGPVGYSYLWNTGDTTQGITTDTTGIFSLEITNANGCSNTDTIVMSITGDLTVNLPDTLVLCEGESLTIQPDSMDANWDFVWSNGETTDSISVTTGGEFWVEVSDSLGCSGRDTVEVITNLVTVDLGKDSIVCLGPVELTANVTYRSYLWNTGDTTQTISADSSRNFWVAVVNPLGCEGRDTILVTISDPLLPQLQDSVFICEGDSIEVNAGSGYDSYAWNGGIDTGMDSTRIFDAEGLYNVRITNALGCFEIDSISVSVEEITIDLGNDTTVCFGEVVTLDAGNYFAYNWTPTLDTTQTTTASSLATGTVTYHFEVTSENGCSASDSTSVTFQDELSVVLSLEDTLTFCPGSQIDLAPEVNGGDGVYTYTWNDGSTLATLNAATEGWYSVTANDGIGCSETDSVYLKENAQLSINLPDTSICEGDTFALTVGYDEANYNINWNTLETTKTIQITIAGVYGVYVDDGNGCFGTDSMTLSINNITKPDLGDDLNICFGSTTTLEATTVYAKYSWNTGEETSAITASAGEYVLNVENAEGCLSADTVTVVEIALPQVNGLLSDADVCVNGSVTFNGAANFDEGNGPYTYAWQDGSTNTSLALTDINNNHAVIQNAGLVWVNITDSFGCSSNDSAFVTIAPGLSVSVIATANDTICEGDSIALSTASFTTIDGYNFDWSNGDTTGTIIVKTTGTYQVNVEKEGCVGLAELPIVVNTLPVVQLDSTASICDGDSVVLDATLIGDYNYLWSDGATQSVNTVGAAGTYQVTVTNNQTGCFASATAEVEVHNIPNVKLPDDITACEGTLLEIEPLINEGTSHIWSDMSVLPKLEVTGGGLYVLAVTANECSNSDSMYVHYESTPFFNIPGGDTLNACVDQLININLVGITPTWDISWNMNNHTGPYISFSAEQNMTYLSATATDGNCSFSDTMVLDIRSVVSELDHSIGDKKYCFAEGDSVILTAGPSRKYNYTWGTSETTSSIVVKEPGTYSVLVYNGACRIMDKVVIEEECVTSLYFPNAFSPNNDGINDEFVPKGNNVSEYHFMVFDRWGELIFETYDINNYWDGTYMGRDAQIDVYVWKASYILDDKSGKLERQDKIGHVSLIR